MNQEIQAYLRVYINHEQSDWKRWLPAAQLAINGRHQSAIGMSPFFATHGYNPPQPVGQIPEAAPRRLAPDSKAADAFVEKIKEITDLCQASMGASVQAQEEAANRKRNAATVFRVGDKVWLNLKNYRTDRLKRSLDFKHAKYTVAEVLTPVTVRLSGIPRGIETVFHTDLLRLASRDPLFGQEIDDNQPEPILIEGEQEWHVEEIRKHRKKRGKGHEVLVKWTGYRQLSWHPREDFLDADAWQAYSAANPAASTLP